ncbi:MAG: hypothetical protein V4471_01060 [Pseudomonadota bacterium]
MLPQVNPEEQSALQEAKEFLSDLLRSGSKVIQEIKEAASCAGHAWRTIRRAKDELRIVPKKEGNKWFWLIPSRLPSTNQVDHACQVVQQKSLDKLAVVKNFGQGLNDSSLINVHSNRGEGYEIF